MNYFFEEMRKGDFIYQGSGDAVQVDDYLCSGYVKEPSFICQKCCIDLEVECQYINCGGLSQVG